MESPKGMGNSLYLRCGLMEYGRYRGLGEGRAHRTQWWQLCPGKGEVEAQVQPAAHSAAGQRLHWQGEMELLVSPRRQHVFLIHTKGQVCVGEQQTQAGSEQAGGWDGVI